VKTKLLKIDLKAFVIAFALILSHLANAQFTMDGAAGQRYGRTTTAGANNVQAIGVGNFDLSLGRIPAAALHVNTNFVTNPFYGVGEAFRTDGPSDQLNAWRLWSGGQNSLSPASEKGMIFNWGNNPTIEDFSNFSIQASIRDMTFHTQPNNNDGIGKERMRIVGRPRFFGSVNYIVHDGNVGIGLTNPAFKLDVVYDINVRTTLPNQGYWINNNVVLQNPGTDNIFVGFGAGVVNTACMLLGINNTFVGFSL